MKTLFTARLCASAAAAMPLFAPAAASAEVYQFYTIAQTPSDVENGIGYPRIRVGGQTNERYDSVVTETVDAWITVSGNWPGFIKVEKNGTKLQIAGGSIPFATPVSPRTYKISFPYVDPNSPAVANVRVSPVKLCNDHLATLQGGQRAAFLNEGANLRYDNAWTARATVRYRVSSGRASDPSGIAVYAALPAPVGAIIQCLALNRPRPQTETTTRGVPGGLGKPGTKMEPTIKSASLRMEPATIERVGNDMCPTQLKLYGQIVAIRKFQGSAIIYGPGFLTPITSLNFYAPGARAVLGTYKLRWDGGVAGSLSAAKPTPKSQTVSLKLNVADTGSKVIETAEETVTITCERAPPQRVALPTPPVPDMDRPTPLRLVAKPVAPGVFDARIRRVDRMGPGGAVQLWVYNAGPDSAAGCTIGVRTDPNAAFQQVATVAAVGAKQTLLMPDALPGAPNSEFRVDCPGESSAAQANNSYRLE